MATDLPICPTRDVFLARAAGGANLIPLSIELIADGETPIGAFQKLLDEDAATGPGGGHTFLLESAEQTEGIGRYSFMGFRPAAVFEARGREIRVTERGQTRSFTTQSDPLTELQALMARYRSAVDPALVAVPFVGGAVGYLGYEMTRFFEPTLPEPPPDDLRLPDALFMITDTLLVFDHRHRRLRVIVNVLLDETAPDAGLAYEAAVARLSQLVHRLGQPGNLRPTRVWPEVDGNSTASSNTTRAEYEDMVRRGQEHILAGDIFQFVPSQRFEAAYDGPPLALYRALRFVNPSPYMFHLQFGPKLAFVGSSPEVHVRAVDDRVEIRPIAGTRKRGTTPEEDAALAAELLADPKERAEHLMLVDLARNDVGRVTNFGTVRVTDFMRVERYSHVMHLVSDVVGVLRPGLTSYDVMRATFPAGTVTGSPKVRAMQIISDFEKSKRGFYAGAVCYFGFDGNLDSCIALRSVVLQDGNAYVQAGAGVVADSVPSSEYEETVSKAAGVLRALDLARQMVD